ASSGAHESHHHFAALRCILARMRNVLRVLAVATLSCTLAAPARTAPARDATSAERQAETLIAERIGAARADAAPDTPPLQADAKRIEIARQRSQDMANGAPFSHQNEIGQYPAMDMMRSEMSPHGAYGENIMEAYDSRGFNPAAFAQKAVDAWMNSPEHRANI